MEISDRLDAEAIDKLSVETTNKRNLYWAFSILSFLILVSMAYTRANVYYIYLVAYIWFGVAYGMMLQYGRFCFASAARDLFANGVARMAVGIMAALVFFGLIQASLNAANMSTFEPGPFGIHMVIGGLVFGVGMVLAGGCASGVLYKVGEGNGTALLAVLVMGFSQAIFAVAGGPLMKILPQSWIKSAATKGLPPGKINSWYDVYLSGYIWDKPATQIAKTSLIAKTFPGASGYFVGDALLSVILPAILILVLIYIIWIRKSFIKKVIKAKGSAGFHDEIAGFWGMVTASKRTTLTGVLIGITAGLQMWVLKGMQNKFGISNFGTLLAKMGHTVDLSTTGKVFDSGFWVIATQESQFAAWVMEKLGMNMHSNVFFGVMSGVPAIWRNPELWMIVGIVLGSMVVALINREFKWKWPKGELIIFGILGGLLMGIGSRLSLGCNVGAFFDRAAGGDPSGWLFFAGMVTGAFVGVKFLNWHTERKMEKAMEAFDI